MTPAVSVVVPTHNRRDLLCQALRSVLAQNAVQVEIVVVDDGSSDGTVEAVQRVNDGRVRVLRHDRAAGVAAARNHGAAEARGAWIALLDDDDLWSPHKTAEQLTEVQQAGRDWVYAGAVEIDAGGRLLGGQPPPSPDELLAGLTSRNLMPAGCSNVMVRAEVFRAVGGFDTSLRHLADWDLWLRLARSGLPACVSQPLVAYRIHQGQATLDPSGMIAEGRLLAARHGADLNSIRRWLAWSYLRRGERRHAVGAYARAVLSGDLGSLGRAAAAALHANPTARRRRSGACGDEWPQAAASWLCTGVD